MRFITDINTRGLHQAETQIEAWQNLVDTCTDTHILGCFIENSHAAWSGHTHGFNLHAELKLIERNGLLSMLVAEYLAYPLAEIESSRTMG